LVQNRLLVNHR